MKALLVLCGIWMCVYGVVSQSEVADPDPQETPAPAAAHPAKSATAAQSKLKGKAIARATVGNMGHVTLDLDGDNDAWTGYKIDYSWQMNEPPSRLVLISVTVGDGKAKVLNCAGKEKDIDASKVQLDMKGSSIPQSLKGALQNWGPAEGGERATSVCIYGKDGKLMGQTAALTTFRGN